jgi:heme exporter protein B
MVNQQIKQFVKKELQTEWRQRYAINGVILQVFSSVMIVYLAVRMLGNPAWNAIFWVIMVFISINSIAKSFIGEGKAKNLYYHQLINPQNLLISKFIYNAGLNVILSFLCLGIYSLLLGNPIVFHAYYLLATALGSIGFAATFTMLSAISSKAGNSNLLMPVLSLPIIIPLLLILIKACKRAMDGIDPSQIQKDLLVLLLFDIMVIGLAYLLFPSVWKE